MVVRVGLADACPLIREGLKELLRKRANLAVDWELSDPIGVPDQLARRPVRLLIIEPFVDPDADAICLVGKLRQDFEKTALLVYTHWAAEDFAISALRAGAAGVLGKSCPTEEIISALNVIRAGKTYFSPSQAQQLCSRYLNGNETIKNPTLSPREKEVLDGIAAGKRLKEIAADLFLSPKTVYTYKARIMERFRLASNADLIHFAENRGEQPSNKCMSFQGLLGKTKGL